MWQVSFFIATNKVKAFHLPSKKMKIQKVIIVNQQEICFEKTNAESGTNKAMSSYCFIAPT